MLVQYKEMSYTFLDHLTSVVGELDRVDGVDFKPQDLEKENTLAEMPTVAAASAGILAG